MLREVEFLYEADLIAALLKLIRSANHKLLLVSPFIDFDAKIMDALTEKKQSHNLELKVLFGKNNNNYLKSMKRNSMEFLQQFPNVEIRYNDRLHAKFYQNDYEYIMTSLNLYDYSLNNNIEVGIKERFANKGLVNQAVDATASLIEYGVNKMKEGVLGHEKNVTPMEKFKTIFDLSELIYKAEPILKETSGLKGFIGGLQSSGSKVLVNKIDKYEGVTSSYPTNLSIKKLITPTNKNNLPKESTKCISATELGKRVGMPSRGITNLMQELGFVNQGNITEEGKKRGLISKTYLDKTYIAYPSDLAETDQVMKAASNK